VTPLPLRARLALVFASGFALLLSFGAVLLYLQLVRGYNRDFDLSLRDGAQAALSIWGIDRPEFVSPEAAVAHVVGELIYGDRTVVAFNAAGRPLAASQRIPDHPYFNDVRPTMALDVPITLTLRDGTARVLRARLVEGIELILAMDTMPLEHRLAKLRLALFTGLPLILVVGALLGAWGAGLVLRPVVEVARAAEQIGQEVADGAGEFDRVPAMTAGDELTTLTEALNLLIERLEAALARERGVAERQRRFLADAAHELRTPVAILRSEAEVALGTNDGAAGYRDALQRIAAEAGELGTLVSDLMLVARSDVEALTPRFARIYLDDIANHAVSRARQLPDGAATDFRREEFEAAPVLGDPALLERAILVLLHNALVHAPGSAIVLGSGIEHRGGQEWAWLTVRDFGPGVPPGQHQRIFERFSRLDSTAPGTGLGLAIARAILESHGGTLTLEEVVPGAGFTLRVPAAGPNGG
jgi:signal transduction histidine kinase